MSKRWSWHGNLHCHRADTISFDEWVRQSLFVVLCAHKTAAIINKSNHFARAFLAKPSQPKAHFCVHAANSCQEICQTENNFVQCVCFVRLCGCLRWRCVFLCRQCQSHLSCFAWQFIPSMRTDRKLQRTETSCGRTDNQRSGNCSTSRFSPKSNIHFRHTHIHKIEWQRRRHQQHITDELCIPFVLHEPKSFLNFEIVSENTFAYMMEKDGKENDAICMDVDIAMHTICQKPFGRTSRICKHFAYRCEAIASVSSSSWCQRQRESLVEKCLWENIQHSHARNTTWNAHDLLLKYLAML